MPRPILNEKPSRNGTKVKEILNEAVKKGMRPEQAQLIMAKALMSDNLMEIYDAVDHNKTPYFTPSSVPTHIVMHMDTNPKFFVPTSERELVEKYKFPEFRLKRQKGNSVVSGNNSDSAYELLLGFNEYFALVGMGRKGSLADRLGLQMLRDRNGEYPMMIEYAGCGVRNRQYQWYTDMIYEYKNAPHLMIKAIHQITRDGTEKYILQSELMILLRLIVMKSRRSETQSHAIIPVLLISIRPHHYVIIEAYYDGRNIHVNYGKPIAMSEEMPPKEQDRRMKFVISWATAQPCGKTGSYRDAPQ
ncbi:hypothetical protein TMEN_2664 [Trichophyton mentagrophytes]|uniref:Uncharacterized protein n=3 Tax=Trichophyton TaxID=5550 RepID=A0A9P5CW20_9EURO|nr:hypothetical protein TEQG_02903 [Trichophyton equinum CBS 127.97]EZF34203.1 hypothetical protein H101_02256 [Trichophyton interdigitale H6]KAF3894664.1 hypothetical protein GY631_3019 [Trichophyton interdigitale]KDB25058.1 hypothetical protein H109_03112 [Trichophyton interdigitale MR816]GBF60252.1 hypothetical protein TMEN_2664 [Trichophyton mentagrophytes]